MNKTRIFVDADSCPSSVRNVILNKAAEKSLEVIFAANRNIPFDFENPLFKMKICPSGKDSADSFIENESSQKDIIITRDILLAGRLLKKNKTVINDRGTRFTEKNISRFLEERELSLQMEALGLHKGKSRKVFGEKELSSFKECFFRELEAVLIHS
ncbi:MAG: DUF188 domain-containing protein [Treponema sp.]|nr:DUF188 domain-containing protein [Treponema sp.]